MYYWYSPLSGLMIFASSAGSSRFWFYQIHSFFVTSTRSVEVTSMWKCLGKKKKMSITHFDTSRGERFVLYLNHFSTDCSQILDSKSNNQA